MFRELAEAIHRLGEGKKNQPAKNEGNNITYKWKLQDNKLDHI